MKKVAIIGKGTAGALSAMVVYGYSLHSNEKILIEWYFDSSIATQAVGEGSNLLVPIHLSNSINFEHHQLNELDGTFKHGVAKRNWSKSHFVHTFKPPLVAYHFNALKLQNFILQKLQSQSNVRIIDKNISSKEIDADLIIDCSGKPESYEDFILSPYMAVNSVHVTQCYWDYAKFQHTISDAAKYGWVFGVPLQNRCSIGYLYNNNFSSLDQVKDDVRNIFETYGLQPSQDTNSFSFQNYYRKSNFVNNIAYNGNSSFFLEPLEATSTGVIILNARQALTAMENKFHKGYNEKLNVEYKKVMEAISVMIMLHYFSGSVFKNHFWEHAEKKAGDCLSHYHKIHPEFRTIIKYCFRCINDERFKNSLFNIDELFKDDKKFKSLIENMPKTKDYGTWYYSSWVHNIYELGLYDKLKNHLNLDDQGNRINQLPN